MRKKLREKNKIKFALQGSITLLASEEQNRSKRTGSRIPRETNSHHFEQDSEYGKCIYTLLKYKYLKIYKDFRNIFTNNKTITQNFMIYLIPQKQSWLGAGKVQPKLVPVPTHYTEKQINIKIFDRLIRMCYPLDSSC